VRRSFGVIAGLAVAIGVWACLPFSQSWIASPPIVGVYRAETGEPISGVQIAIASAGDDFLCTSPSIQTITDSTGAFQLPAKVEHEAVIVVAPFERFVSYSLCARVGGSLRLAFEDHAPVGSGFHARSISLTCVESRTPNTKPVVCTKQR
jgi:hypothetical protein